MSGTAHRTVRGYKWIILKSLKKKKYKQKETEKKYKPGKLVIISCIFGNKFKKVHKAPNKKISFFFTNNPSLKNEIISKGWNYIYVNKPLSDDILISSLQSKYIKFLIFLEDFPEFKDKIIIYSDHKVYINHLALNKIKTLIKNNLNKSIIIGNEKNKINGKIKNKIYDEINAAMDQPRYSLNMNKTKKFVDKMISSGSISPNVRICNTSILVYINHCKLKELLTNIYNKCMEHQQPECQIYWNVFSQKFKNQIKRVDVSRFGSLRIKNIK